MLSDDARRESIKWAKMQAGMSACVVSGFQSRLEREVFDIILQHGGKAIWILASRIFRKCPAKYMKAVKEGRLLILSYFDEMQARITRGCAEQRNRKVVPKTTCFWNHGYNGGAVQILARRG